MKHKIFVSQATLKLGRNRQHRMLEAKLDNKTEVIHKKEGKECKHKDYCNIMKFGRINCLFEQKHCQTYIFYERYGRNYNQMFIGSKK